MSDIPRIDVNRFPGLSPTGRTVHRALRAFDSVVEALSFYCGDGQFVNPDGVCEFYDEIDDGALALLRDAVCAKFGHDWAADQCGIRAHDYCVLCAIRRDEVETDQSGNVSEGGAS